MNHPDLAWMNDRSLRVKPPVPVMLRRRRFWRTFWIASALLAVCCGLWGAAVQ